MRGFATILLAWSLLGAALGGAARAEPYAPDAVRVLGVNGYEYVSRARATAARPARPGRRKAAASLSLAGFPAPLVAKVRELEAVCGARLISAFRPGAKIRGSGRPSLHASKRAVDMAGNASCIYARMKDWPGGYSTDYSAVAHIHISYAPGGAEWGARFAHWRPRNVRRVGYGG